MAGSRARVAVMFCAALVALTFTGCFGSGETIHGSVEVPLPEAGAWAVYRIEQGELAGQEVRFTVLGMGMRPFVDGEVYPVVLVSAEYQTECLIVDATSDVYRVTEYDPVQRIGRSSGVVLSDCPSEDDVGLGEVFSNESFDTTDRANSRFVEFMDWGWTGTRNPLNHVNGQVLGGQNARISFGFTGIVREDINPLESMEPGSGVSAGKNMQRAEHRLVYTLESIRETRAGDEAVVRQDRFTEGEDTPSRTYYLGYRDGVPFPVWDGGEPDEPVRTLVSWGAGDQPLDWSVGAPPHANRPEELPVQRVPPLGPPAIGVPFAYDLAEALAAVEADENLATYQKWRRENPDGRLLEASLRPYEDRSGRTGWEWAFVFEDVQSVRSVQVTEPAALAGTWNREPVVENAVQQANPLGFPRHTRDPTDSVELADTLSGLLAHRPVLQIDWAGWSYDDECWRLGWTAREADGWHPYPRTGVLVDTRTGAMVRLLEIDWSYGDVARDFEWGLTHSAYRDHEICELDREDSE